MRKRHPDSTWPERDEVLIRLWTAEIASGDSWGGIYRIAKVMGLNKNQVIGRARRLRLPALSTGRTIGLGSKEAIAKRKEAAAARLSRNGRPVNRRPPPKMREYTPRVFGRLAKCDAVVGPVKDFENDGRCGKETMPGKSYCESHWRAFCIPAPKKNLMAEAAE